MVSGRYDYKSLLKDDANLKRWYDNGFRSSPAAADARLRRIGYVCRTFKICNQCGSFIQDVGDDLKEHYEVEHRTTDLDIITNGYSSLSPAKLSKMNSKKTTNMIFDVIASLEKHGGKKEYVSAVVKALKNFSEHNDNRIIQRFKISNINDIKEPTKTQLEQSPTPDQVKLVFDASDIKQRLTCSLVSFSGVRPETIGNYLGNDGLRVMDFPEMIVDSKSRVVEFKKVPTLVVVRANLSKAGHQYMTFFPDEGCTYLKEVLEFKMREGQNVDMSTPVVTSIKYANSTKRAHLAKNQPLKTPDVSESMRTAIRAAGFDWRPYILRTYFDTRMMMAEADGLIIKDWRVFWMGHRGDMEHRYTLNKGKLPDDVIEKMRLAFEKASTRYLVTTVKREGEMTADQRKHQIRVELLLVAGFPNEEIQKMGDLSGLSSDDFQKIVREGAKRALGLNGNTQKVVPMDEVEGYIVQGWEFVKELTPHKAIIRLPK